MSRIKPWKQFYMQSQELYMSDRSWRGFKTFLVVGSLNLKGIQLIKLSQKGREKTNIYVLSHEERQTLNLVSNLSTDHFCMSMFLLGGLL